MAALVYSVDLRGIEVVRDLDALGKNVPIAASRAINSTAKRTRTKSAREIRQQINFKARYLSGANGKITDKKKASPSSLSAILAARSRPTSLAHFAVGASRRRGAGVKVSIEPGVVRHLRRAFFVNLRAGDSEVSNVGLAIRSDTKPGRAYKPKRLGRNLWLLYGPSVSQSLINARQSGIWSDLEVEIGVELETEFSRLLGVLK